jgi:hypothetical protein
MAAMDMRRARAIAEQKIKSGQNKGLGLEDLVQQIIAESAGAGAPGTAIGAALVPVTLTPAATAPMQPGVPFVAPKPTTEMVPAPQEQELPVAPQRAARPSRYQPELDRVMANIAVAEQAMAGKQPNVTDQIRLGGLKQQAERLGALVRAEQSPEAEIPEEMRAALEGRQARLARREELLAEQKARSPFAALLAAGAAGTQGRRGETDVEAITRILQAGFGGYDQSRRGFEEGTEKIAEARDQAMIDRYNMQEKASEAAVQRARDIVGMGREARDEAIKEVRLPTQIGAEEAAAELAKLNLQNAPEMAKLDRLVALARIANENRGNRGGLGVGKEPAGLNDYRDQMSKALNTYSDLQAEYESARADPDSLPADVAKLRNKVIAAGQRYNAYGQALRNRYNVNPDIVIPEKGLFAPKTGAKASATTGGKGWSAIKF